MNSSTLAEIDEYISSSRKAFESSLSQVVSIPTVSADTTCISSINEAAKLAVKFLAETGFSAKVVPTDNLPIVYAELIQDKRYPTVLLYNHLDVQPADPDEWDTDPFQLSIKGDTYYGRGATDDKGPALTTLFAVKYAIKNKMPLNFKYIWEFEEEIGSGSFEGFVKKHKDLLKTNSIIVSDTIWISNDKPAIPTGLRGMVLFEIILQTGSKDTHSGLTGGVARNPIGEVAQIISECYDAMTGKVKIPGFYEDVVAPTSKEMDSYLSSGFSVEEFLHDHDLYKVRTKDIREVISKTLVEPTFEVHGIVGGYVGPGVKTIVPHKAVAKISCRLVPRQDPDKIFQLIKDYIQSAHPDVDVIFAEKLMPYAADISGPYAKAVEIATEYAFNTKPAFVREGGSIGSVLTMDEYLKAPIMMIGLSLPRHGYHAPNECYDWTQASGGIKMLAKYFEKISVIKP